MMERRKDKRIQEENRVVIEFPNPENRSDPWNINAFTRDLSLGGARILTDISFSIGSEITMTLFLSKSKQIAKTHGKIKWVRTVDDGLYEMGIEFQHNIPSSVVTLINHLYRKDQAITAHIQA